MRTVRDDRSGLSQRLKHPPYLLLELRTLVELLSRGARCTGLGVEHRVLAQLALHLRDARGTDHDVHLVLQRRRRGSRHLPATGEGEQGWREEGLVAEGSGWMGDGGNHGLAPLTMRPSP